VPALTATIVSLQVGVPPAQLSLPWWQALVGVQAAPSTQSVQAPSLHTLPIPHIPPFGALPLSRQTGAPVLQASVPVRQGLATGHVAPALHIAHEPLLQT
jgi:hypothetical protein